MKFSQFLFLFFCIGFAAPAAFACECIIKSHRNYFRDAEMVFVGTVENLKKESDLSVIPKEVKDARAQFTEFITFNVTKKYKGDKQTSIDAWSFSNPNACGGFRWKHGEKYLVYLFKSRIGDLAVETFCTRSRPVDTKDDRLIKESRQLDSFWFRLGSRVWPF